MLESAGTAAPGAGTVPHSVTLFVSSVTAPFRASVRPESVAPVFSVMLVSARMLPAKTVFVPSVAELPTCQKMLQLVAPLISATFEMLAVVKVLPILNRNCAAELPCALSVSVPVSCADEEKQYTPGVSVRPPRFCPDKSTVQGVPATVLYAVVSSFCA